MRRTHCWVISWVSRSLASLHSSLSQSCVCLIYNVQGFNQCLVWGIGKIDLVHTFRSGSCSTSFKKIKSNPWKSHVSHKNVDFRFLLKHWKVNHPGLHFCWVTIGWSWASPAPVMRLCDELTTGPTPLQWLYLSWQKTCIASSYVTVGGWACYLCFRTCLWSPGSVGHKRDWMWHQGKSHWQNPWGFCYIIAKMFSLPAQNSALAQIVLSSYSKKETNSPLSSQEIASSFLLLRNP